MSFLQGAMAATRMLAQHLTFDTFVKDGHVPSKISA
jgi:hypothetical protein